MKLKHYLSTALVLILVFGCFLYAALHHTPDYSYHAFYISHHIPVPACTLDGTRKTAQGVVLCAESSRMELPSGAQTNVWVGYILWNACNQYGDRLACDELED